ncbi:lambda exonuclease family protein [Sutterella sp.]|uniref:lambda exonuclease family protein n=1 Tax=Sutterella sp. TaxID=1981025 RepID=UPI0026DF5060|nr:lambda exonuclease family protein [Sutterella sp.]MDO5532872.1 YqaJ viral recombinase family protein [Sutterella sp.]
MAEDFDSGNPLQRTSQWLNDRHGCLTASRAAAVINRRRDGKPTAAYQALMGILIAERITGEVIGTGTTPAMQWGIEHEAEARDAYEVETGELVDLVGFVPHPEIPWFGASPDGLVGDDGLLEIKCPNTTTHLERIAAGVVPEEYRPQMLVQLLCTGRRWVDFVDYDPRLKGPWKHLKFWTIRFQPTDEELEQAEKLCRQFLAEAQALFEKLQSLTKPAIEAAASQPKFEPFTSKKRS